MANNDTQVKVGIVLVCFMILFCMIYYPIAYIWIRNDDGTSLINVAPVIKIKQTDEKHFVLKFLFQQNYMLASIVTGTLLYFRLNPYAYYNYDICYVF